MRYALLIALLAGCGLEAHVEAGAKHNMMKDTLRFRAELEIPRLKMELEQYHALHHEWPEDWRFTRRHCLDPWGEPYLFEIEVDGNRALVYSAGPDREPGTGDEVYAAD